MWLMKVTCPPIAPALLIAMIGIRHIPLAAVGKFTPIFGMRGRGLRPQLADAVVENLLRLLRSGVGPTETSQGDPLRSATDGRDGVIGRQLVDS
jgi:hypothetical protein